MAFKNFIVPIDFSEYSLNGLEFALLFANQSYANIQMVYVLRKSSDYYPSSVDAEKEYAERNFNKLIEQYSPRLKNDSRLRFITKRGKIYREIVSQAQSYKDSLIIATTHGASGFEEFFIGSNVYKIVTATRRPVITVRKKCPDSIKKIVLPIEIKGDSRQKVPYTAELAQFFNAKINIVGIHTSRNKRTRARVTAYCRQVSGYLHDKAENTVDEVHGDNTAELVVNYANAVHADLISIMSEQTSGINLILGNTAHILLNRSAIPVLCISPKELRISGTFKTSGG
jgi:nucleotide-binding universal stress UspA family protein